MRASATCTGCSCGSLPQVCLHHIPLRCVFTRLDFQYRYERAANEMLAKSTIAGQEGVVTYLANAAALQQFEQTALAYVLMSEAGRPMSIPSLAAAAESLLEGRFQVCMWLPDMCNFPYHSCGTTSAYAACLQCSAFAACRLANKFALLSARSRVLEHLPNSNFSDNAFTCSLFCMQSGSDPCLHVALQHVPFHWRCDQ